MLTYGDITRDPATLPAASVTALLARGFSHYLGNEQAAKVVSRIRTELAGEGKASDVTKDQVQAFRLEHSAKVKEMEAAVAADALKALDEGTIGARTGTSGPRLAPLDKMISRVAREFVTTKLQANGLKVPKGEETLEIGGKAVTMAHLVERQIAANGDVVKKEAERRIADAQRKLAKAKVEGAASLDSLGL